MITPSPRSLFGLPFSQLRPLDRVSGSWTSGIMSVDHASLDSVSGSRISGSRLFGSCLWIIDLWIMSLGHVSQGHVSLDRAWTVSRDHVSGYSQL